MSASRDEDEVVAARLRELRALQVGGATARELAIHLAALGYDEQRAATLLARLDDRALGEDQKSGSEFAAELPLPGAAGAVLGPDLAATPAAPLRVWAPFERQRFSADAWGQLLRLRADGMGDAELEHLIDRALFQLDGPVGVAELRALLGDAVADAAAAAPTEH